MKYYRVSEKLKLTDTLYRGHSRLHRHRGRIGRQIDTGQPNMLETWIELDLPEDWSRGPGQEDLDTERWWFYRRDLISATEEEYNYQKIVDRLGGG